MLSNVGARALAVGTALCVVAGGFAAGGMAAAAPGCEVDYLVQNKWQGGFSANVTIKNLGDPVDGWRLAWTFPGSERYGEGWNATFVPSGADVVASNVDWNRAIPSGGSVSFGFNGTVSGSEVGEPQAFTLNGVLCTGGVEPTTTTTTTTTTTSPDPGPEPGDPTGRKQVERLDRGVVSVRSGSGNLVSWRLLAGDARDTGFNVYRGGTKLNSAPITASTNYLDSGGPSGASYTVRAIVNGAEQPASPASLSFGAGYLDVPISPPGSAYTANDASVGDADGDGQYEIFLKWYPNNAKDNAQAGVTDNTFIDAYRLDGTRLWRIDLGRNIRSGAHYTQFQVYDYDGDGRAEIAMKTADGTRDGRGTVIGSASADHRNGDGYVLAGPEFLTMFSGLNGAALSTVNYDPPRGNVASWGDGYGNRVDRFLAGTAYLDGARPSLIMARGYYTRAVIAAWDFRDGRLVKRWTFDSNASGNGTYAGQGNHSLTIGDVDADGRDEIVYGAAVVDDNGRGLWNTRFGHGDAAHLGDLDPSRPGLEYYKVSENGSQPGSWFADARTGQVLWRTAPAGDNGRGVSGDVHAGSPGAESWSSADSQLRNTRGETVGRKPSSANFLIWWDGDPSRELLDGTHVDKYGTGGDTRLLTGSNVHSNNGTKSTPSLSGDILGDWREEVIWPTSDNRALRVYSTPNQTDRRIPTLMHDPMYRAAIAWQNTAYNQPPHPSFHIGGGMATPPWPDVHYAK
ncbi:rhamnogalacturonan lyase family protein [Lentzea californiensis]|uniref:rhamnogalacturonan lyase family protein n=1 Tax=Lentzea californiensis TaxID=438851 RepID=UPI0035576AFD|nr:Cellulose binding domain-containing protein [Lentzea californiensis]